MYARDESVLSKQILHSLFKGAESCCCAEAESAAVLNRKGLDYCVSALTSGF